MNLAAVRKPKFYALGTTGGLVGQWRQERVVCRSPIEISRPKVLFAAPRPTLMLAHQLMHDDDVAGRHVLVHQLELEAVANSFELAWRLLYSRVPTDAERAVAQQVLGTTTLIECGKPCDGSSTVCTPPPLPTLLPP